jgi:hypothetical protein
VLSLLVVLALVGVAAKKQLQSVHTRPADVAAGASMPVPGGTPAQQSQQLQNKVRDDVNKLMQEAPARLEPAQ